MDEWVTDEFLKEVGMTREEYETAEALCDLMCPCVEEDEDDRAE